MARSQPQFWDVSAVVESRFAGLVPLLAHAVNSCVHMSVSLLPSFECCVGDSEQRTDGTVGIGVVRHVTGSKRL